MLLQFRNLLEPVGLGLMRFYIVKIRINYYFMIIFIKINFILLNNYLSLKKAMEYYKKIFN